MIYLDSSAAVKLVREEPWSADLGGWLDEHPDEALASSVLVEVEVWRALRRAEPAALGRAPAVVARLHRVDLDTVIRATAAAYDLPTLRSLDAIHLATAQILHGQAGPLVGFVAYDDRLLEAATSMGLPAVSPGRR